MQIDEFNGLSFFTETEGKYGFFKGVGSTKH